MQWKNFLYEIIVKHTAATGSDTFTFGDLYDANRSIIESFSTSNHSPKATVQGTLQVLRNSKKIEFVDNRGTYRLIDFDPTAHRVPSPTARETAAPSRSVKQRPRSVSIQIEAPAGTFQRSHSPQVHKHIDDEWHRAIHAYHNYLALVSKGRPPDVFEYATIITRMVVELAQLISVVINAHSTNPDCDPNLPAVFELSYPVIPGEKDGFSEERVLRIPTDQPITTELVQKLIMGSTRKPG